MIEIRLSKIKDLKEILNLYEIARKTMRDSGNPDQWKDNRPSREVVVEDIVKQRSYLICEDEKIKAVFVLAFGKDPTYEKIYDGSWLNDEEYATIHRVASDGSLRGVLKRVLDFSEGRISNIRIDTHRDNKIMIGLLEKYGYKRCGIIYVEDGTKRIAYQKKIEA